MENTATTTPTPEATTTTAKKTTPGLIAVVQRYAGPGEQRAVEFVHARTKVEMRKALADPSVATVVGLVRGRAVQFTESRNVAF